MAFLLVSLDIIKITKNVISGCIWAEEKANRIQWWIYPNKVK